MKKAVLILALALTLAGCLEKEVTQTMYFEPDGSVTWEVLERNVYSSADSPEDRAREEREYFKAAMAGRPTVLASLEEIGGYDLRSELLRDTPPYSVRVTARFKDPGTALAALFEAADIDAEVLLSVREGRHELTITPTETGTDGIEGDGNEPIVDELLLSDGLRFVLAAGRFEDSNAFSIDARGRQAIWSLEHPGDEELEVYRLSWRLPEGHD